LLIWNENDMKLKFAFGIPLTFDPKDRG